MSNAPASSCQEPGFKPLAWISIIGMVISAISLTIWGWMLRNRADFPDPNSTKGEHLLRSYQTTTHEAVLVLLAGTSLAITALIIRARLRNTHTSFSRGRLQDLLSFAREQPLATVLFVAYTVAMVQGTSWMYPELVGWYRDVFSEHLLNNFTVRNALIGETMRRSDYRFFPLAHQDLHVLSWLTAYVKVWMLVNAAELIAIVILATRFVRRLSGLDTKHGPALLVMTSLLLMVHPSTAQSFFQFIYCERLLTLVFTLYISAYLHYRHTSSIASFYSTWLCALIGLFIKDLAFVLFLGPPIVILILGSLGLMKGRVSLHRHQLKAWSHCYKLELWLIGLIPIFLGAYTTLSLLPSTFANQGNYAEQREIVFNPDWRFLFLTSLTASRVTLAMFNRLRLHLLDALNITALSYSLGLLILVGYRSSSYLALPVHLITVLNMTWLWGAFLAPSLNQIIPWRLTASLGTAASLTILAIEPQLDHPSFFSRVKSIKRTQDSWTGAYLNINQIASTIKQNGEAVNIIYNGNSWLSPRRHLHRIRYDRLIEYNSNSNKYQIVDGVNKGQYYSPIEGDLIINIDKKVSNLGPILNHNRHHELYRHNNRDKSGAIFRLGEASQPQTAKAKHRVHQ